MAQTITNQASLNYRYNGQEALAVSNIASATLTDPLSADKNALESYYQAQGLLTFVVSFINSSSNALSNVSVSDDLGTYVLNESNVTPLTLVSSALLYVNGVYRSRLTPSYSANSVTFNVGALPAGANAVIIYKVNVNSAAPLAIGSQITNTATVTADGLTSSVAASHTIPVEEYARVSITKSMSPASVVDGSNMTYNFTIYNHGNSEATNIVLTDTFNPAPTSISVQVNGEAVNSTDYTYAGGALTLPTGTAYALSLPAASISQDPATGITTVTPSKMEITVTGTL